MRTSSEWRSSPWIPGRFEISVELENRSVRSLVVSGEMKRPFAIHARNGRWFLDHLRTGRSIAWVASAEQGRRLAERLVELTESTAPWEEGWTTVETIPAEILVVIELVGVAIEEAREG